MRGQHYQAKHVGIDAIFFESNESMLMGVAAMLCGTALLHLVLIRMVRKRKHQKDPTEVSGDVGSRMTHPPVFFRVPYQEHA